MSFLGVYVEQTTIPVPSRSPTPLNLPLSHESSHGTSKRRPIVVDSESENGAQNTNGSNHGDNLNSSNTATIRISSIARGKMNKQQTTVKKEETGIEAKPAAATLTRAGSQSHPPASFDPQPSSALPLAGGNASKSIRSPNKIAGVASTNKPPPTVWYGNRPPPRPWMKRSIPSNSGQSEVKLVPKREIVKEESVASTSASTSKKVSPAKDSVKTNSRAKSIVIDLSLDSSDEDITIQPTKATPSSSTTQKRPKSTLPTPLPSKFSAPSSSSRSFWPQPKQTTQIETRSPIRIKIRSKHAKRRVPTDDEDDSDVDFDALLQKMANLKDQPVKSRGGKLAAQAAVRSASRLKSPVKIKERQRPPSPPPTTRTRKRSNTLQSPARRSQRDSIPSTKCIEMWDAQPASTTKMPKPKRIDDNYSSGTLIINPYAVCRASITGTDALQNVRKAPESSQAAQMAAAAMKRKQRKANQSDNSDDDITITSPAKRQRVVSTTVKPLVPIRPLPIPEEMPPLMSAGGSSASTEDAPTPQVPVFSFPEIVEATTPDGSAMPFRPTLCDDFFLSASVSLPADKDAMLVDSSPRLESNDMFGWATPINNFLSTSPDYASFGSVSTITSCSSSASELVTPVGSPMTDLTPFDHRPIKARFDDATLANFEDPTSTFMNFLDLPHE